MIRRKHLAALLGFAFVAAWVGFSFGAAILCLLGAALFYYAAALVEGEIDLGELQARFSGEGQRRGARTQ
jgi:predicted alpha/beta hydrolase